MIISSDPAIDNEQSDITGSVSGYQVNNNSI